MPKLDFPKLVELGKSGLQLADPAQDVRDHKVVDKDGEMIGEVKDMLIDEDDRKARFLLVESGGFLGIGEQTIMIPVESITLIESRIVYVSYTREHTAKGPHYDPDRGKDESFWSDAYGHYESEPFWAPGYRPHEWPTAR